MTRDTYTLAEEVRVANEEIRAALAALEVEEDDE